MILHLLRSDLHAENAESMDACVDVELSEAFQSTKAMKCQQAMRHMPPNASQCLPMLQETKERRLQMGTNLGPLLHAESQDLAKYVEAFAVPGTFEGDGPC